MYGKMLDIISVHATYFMDEFLSMGMADLLNNPSVRLKKI